MSDRLVWDNSVPFDEDAICDRCGKFGAFDFMGDFYCPKCLTTDSDGNVAVKGDEATDDER